MLKYARPEMQAVWENENKFKNWLEIELLVCEALEELGEIPKGSVKKIRTKANFDVKRIDQIETDIRHNVVAFITNLVEHLGDDAKYVHRGITSSDVQDTGYSMMLRQAADLIIESLDRLLGVLRSKIDEHKTTLCVGRTHGMHAEPTTFGLKLLHHYLVFSRAKERMLHAKEEISVCSLSGDVGAFSTINPKVEEYVAGKLNFKRGSIGTQVVSRDRHAMFFATLSIIAASIEAFTIEIRHLQRTEVGEIEEPFYVWDKGSKAMPHKHNPVVSENLTGLTRIIRSTISPILENISLWHESDLSHFSVESVMAPCTTTYLDFAINQLTDLISGMSVRHDRMIKNLEMSKGLIFSHHVITALINGGMSRDYANNLIQDLSEKVYSGESANFLEVVKADETVLEYVDKDALTKIFDYSASLSRITEIIDTCLAKKDAKTKEEKEAA